MYKNKFNKYTNKLKQLGGLSCSLKVFNEVYIPGDNDSGLITGLNYDINGESKKYYYPSVDEEIVDPHPELDVRCTSATVQKDNPLIVGNLSFSDVPIQNLQDVNLLTQAQFMRLTVNDYNNINVNVLGIWFAKFLRLDELINLSGLNSHINNALASYRFDFYEQPFPLGITLTDFRRIFPLAIGINLVGSEIEDDEFINNILPRHDPNNRKLKNILRINISSVHTLTDNAFIVLNTWIHTLDMRRCTQLTITDAAFSHLRGVHTLYMGYCNQLTITDAAFVYLQGIHTLDITLCRQITDAAFAHLRGVHTLNMTLCKQQTITDAAFTYLTGINTLTMSGCNQETITDAAFAHLQGVRGVHTLDMSYCYQATITGNSFCLLNSLKKLTMLYCNETALQYSKSNFWCY
jgi:hypothetical protein